jgi:hypothetical protein
LIHNIFTSGQNGNTTDSLLSTIFSQPLVYFFRKEAIAMNQLTVVKGGMVKKGLEQIKPKSSFHAALTYCSRQKGYGVQSWISRKTGLTQQYIHLLIFGERDGDEDTRRIIADTFGYSYEEFLRLGETVLRGLDPEELDKLKRKDDDEEMQKISNRAVPTK